MSKASERDQHVTIILNSGERVEFNCSSFGLVKNGFKDTTGFSWENADRYVWVDFEQVAGVTVDEENP